MQRKLLEVAYESFENGEKFQSYLVKINYK